MTTAFQWIKDNGGICTEEAFPYDAKVDKCMKCKVVPGTAPKGWVDVHQSDMALMTALTVGPVSVAIQVRFIAGGSTRSCVRRCLTRVCVAPSILQANQRAFQLYKGGVLTGRCGTQLDHGVVAVGFGTEDGQDYYKIRNR